MKHETLFDDTQACKELFENANDLIQSVDENGRFLYVNKKWQDALGYTDEEARRMVFSDIIHQNHLQACFAAFAEMKTGKSFDNFKTQFVAKNGRVIDVDGNISVRIKDGTFLYTWGIFREVIPHTEIEDALRQEQKFSQALIDSLPSVFYVFEVPSLHMVRWNRALVHIFGFSNEETARMSPIDFIDARDKKKVQEAVRNIIAKGKDAVEAHARAKDGGSIPYFFSAVHATIAEKGYVVGIGIDITDLRKREEELDRVAKMLVRRDFEFLQTSDILRVRDEQIIKEQELNRAKGEFVSLASHQLRTPLTTASWYAEMLLRERVGKVTKKQKEYLEKIFHASRRMVELVNALLNASRIELGTFAMEPKPVRLAEIAESVLDELLPNIKGKKLRIEKSYEKNLPIINADPQWMRIVFQNLLSNAVKYTQDKGKISLAVEAQKPDILIKVSDNGYGIPKAQQAHIFEKLFRADNAREKDPEGTGLGLYIVKFIVEKAGGKIWFESPLSETLAKEGRENRGTIFYVTIPIKGMEKKRGTKELA